MEYIEIYRFDQITGWSDQYYKTHSNSTYELPMYVIIKDVYITKYFYPDGTIL